MKIKYGKKRVNGWNYRHLNQIEVLERLRKRIHNGFTLDSVEAQFYDDTVALIKLYMPDNKLACRVHSLSR